MTKRFVAGTIGKGTVVHQLQYYPDRVLAHTGYYRAVCNWDSVAHDSDVRTMYSNSTYCKRCASYNHFSFLRKVNEAKKGGVRLPAGRKR